MRLCFFAKWAGQEYWFLGLGNPTGPGAEPADVLGSARNWLALALSSPGTVCRPYDDAGESRGLGLSELARVSIRMPLSASISGGLKDSQVRGQSTSSAGICQGFVNWSIKGAKLVGVLVAEIA